MSIAIGEDHQALLDTARRFTADRIPPAVVRAAVDGADEALPPFWDELAGLGWTGLHLPEAVGGEGYGFAELVVVVEELGRALAPGPFLPSVWASAAIQAAEGPKELLERLRVRRGGRHRRARSRRWRPPPATTARSCSAAPRRPC